MRLCRRRRALARLRETIKRGSAGDDLCVYSVAFAEWQPTVRASNPFWKLIF
jgi:hypothetical protein